VKSVKSARYCKPNHPFDNKQGVDQLKEKRRKRVKYDESLPSRLYTFFVTYQETSGAPSITKFARSIGATTAEIESFRSHKRFDEAYRECGEIRRDYLIDNALTKRYDPSFVKFLLSAYEEEEASEDNEMTLTLEVVRP
jgi:hypothetical protein